MKLAFVDVTSGVPFHTDMFLPIHIAIQWSRKKANQDKLLSSILMEIPSVIPQVKVLFFREKRVNRQLRMHAVTFFDLSQGNVSLNL